MEFRVSKESLKRNLRDTLRSAGYFGLRNRFSSETGYVRRLSLNQFYPRFHLYLTELPDSLRFKLHLDQKKESYQGVKAHSADYEEETVKEEAERILRIFNEN